ncbi:MAG: hypothetical protein CLLPBCKN_007229 [Chroococcidiopsis cubana SAG 39.79]|nr:hypothetical protein [Chroococcidiopsis cubana SAG 39.79]
MTIVLAIVTLVSYYTMPFVLTYAVCYCLILKETL